MNGISKIKIYLKERMAYIDEDLRVWERHNEYEYRYSGLNLRKEMQDSVGKDIEKEDMIIVYNIVKNQHTYMTDYVGVIINRDKFIENLLI